MKKKKNPYKNRDFFILKLAYFNNNCYLCTKYWKNMYRKKKRHRNKKGRSGAINQYGVISSSQSIYDPIPKGKKNKKAKKLTILGLEPKLFEALCESVPLRHDITVFDIKYR